MSTMNADEKSTSNSDPIPFINQTPETETDFQEQKSPDDGPRGRGNSGRFRFSFRKKSQRKQRVEDLIQKCSFINLEEANTLETELTTECGITSDQIYEHGGLASALAFIKCYSKENLQKDAILVCCGPGNNGAFGLVMARYIKIFGYKPTVYYPKTPVKKAYKVLLEQCEKLNISLLSYIPSDVSLINHNYSVIVDALFGFCFASPVREDLATVLEKLRETCVPIVSLDLPSGWEAETAAPDGLKPETLISIFMPKKSSLDFVGKRHILAGRIIPNSLAKKLNIKLPVFGSNDQLFLVLHEGVVDHQVSQDCKLLGESGGSSKSDQQHHSDTKKSNTCF